MNIALILAGGVGSRVGANCPKQFIEVSNRPIIAYTIDKFEANDDIDMIVLVCVDGYISKLSKLVEKEKFLKVAKIVVGGETFQDSVINGIDCLSELAKDDDIVLIHYGASPFVDNEIISDAIRVCTEKGNASPAREMIPLSAHVDLSDSTAKELSRDKIICLNSPQALRYGYVCKLYKKAIEEDLIDDIDPHTTSLMLALGERIYYSLDKTTNIKITTKEDVELFRAWIKYSLNS